MNQKDCKGREEGKRRWEMGRRKRLERNIGKGMEEKRILVEKGMIGDEGMRRVG